MRKINLKNPRLSWRAEKEDSFSITIRKHYDECFKIINDMKEMSKEMREH